MPLDAKGKFSLPKLPYAENALEPVISARTISFHYGKHHKAYVDKLNELVVGTPYESLTLEEIVRKAAGNDKDKAIFNNAGQIWNHNFYWESMTPKGGSPAGKIADAIKSSFGGIKEFNEAFFWADGKVDFFAREVLGTRRQADSGKWLLLAAIGTLMLLFMTLPALNLINLNTGRILERSAEIGVRKAFGASSRQLVWQFVVENVLLCLVGSLFGLVFAKLALAWLEGSGLIPYLHVNLNLAVFGWGLLLAVVFGLLSGVIPAWKMSRLHPVQALKGAV